MRMTGMVAVLPSCSVLVMMVGMVGMVRIHLRICVTSTQAQRRLQYQHRRGQEATQIGDESAHGFGPTDGLTSVNPSSTELSAASKIRSSSVRKVVKFSL